MKQTSPSIWPRAAMLLGVLGSAGIAWAETDVAADLVARRLATDGAVPVHSAGPYVERGTFRIQVLAKLGPPDATLADGAFCYANRNIEGSLVRGTLVIRFDGGRVSDLVLATPQALTAIRAGAEKTSWCSRTVQMTPDLRSP